MFPWSSHPTKRIDISILDQIHLENLPSLPLNPELGAELFRYTDLVFDEKTGELKSTDPNGETTSFEQEAKKIDVLRAADTNHDHYLDFSEVSNLLRNRLDSYEMSDVSDFTNHVDQLTQKRYPQLAANLQVFKKTLPFRRTPHALELYNRGVLKYQLWRAGLSFQVDNPVKSIVNVGLLSFKGLANFFTDTSYWQGDAWAEDFAMDGYKRGEKAIEKLRRVIAHGIEGQEPWAVNGDLNEALRKLDNDTRELLDHRLALNKIYGIMNTKDRDERSRKFLAFIGNESPGTLGFGGGNTSDFSIWNNSGKVINNYFKQSVALFLVNESGGDPRIGDQAYEMLNDSHGQGGDLIETVYYVTDSAVCGIKHMLGLDCTSIPFRSWSDENKITGFSRGFVDLLALFGGMKSTEAVIEAERLWRSKGLGEVFRIWRENSGWRNLGGLRMPIKAWRAARIGEVANNLTRGQQMLRTVKSFGDFLISCGEALGGAVAAGMVDKIQQSSLYNPFYGGDIEDDYSNLHDYPDPTRPASAK